MFDYESVAGDYQYQAIRSGNKVQKFWHLKKIDIVHKESGVNKENTILEVGCGSGNILLSLAKGAKKAVGADISSKAVAFGNKRAKEERINAEFVQTEAGKKLPFKDNSFDKVYFIEVIEHLTEKDYQFLLEEIYRVLKEGGSFFITTPNYRSHWPLVEWLTDLFKLTPAMRDEQHISKFSMKKLKNVLRRNKFKLQKTGSFYFKSPFVAMVSEKLAERTFKIENKLKLPGMILYAKSTK